jgi:hypothetical protein
MPASETLDMKADANNNDVFASRILVQVTISTGSPAVKQLHYRWRNDDGDETSASWLQTEDNPVPASFDVNIGTRKRLRLLIDNTTGTASASNFNYRLEHASSSCSNWYEVPTTEAMGQKGWVMDLSVNVADQTATTDLGGVSNPGEGSFTAGYVMTSSNDTPALSLTTSQFSELEYSIKSTANAETGLLYCFRLTDAGDTTYFTWSQQPQITLSIFNRGGGGDPFESPGVGSIITGGGLGGGGNIGGESGGSGPPVGGGGQGGGGGVEGVSTSLEDEILSELAGVLSQLSHVLETLSGKIK